MLSHHQKPEGVLELPRFDATGATLRVDRMGMRSLFDVAYAASLEEREEDKVRKNKKKEEVPPKRQETREEVDAKTGKIKRKTVYIYDVVVPRGAFLLDEDPTRKGDGGLWIKLWRDFIWTIVRGVPTTRGPYERRASNEMAEDGDASKKMMLDGDEAFEALARVTDQSKKLTGTDYLGAQTETADGVPFEDQERFAFLLQFWPFAVSLYVPSYFDTKEGKTKFDRSFAVVVPDVSVLDEFCIEHFASLRERSGEARAYLPDAAVIDLPEEAALAEASTLFERLSRREAASNTASLVTGYEVYHVQKDGNNVRVHRSARLAPSRAMVDRYRTIETRFSEFLFRRQQLVNLIEARPWWSGYDRLFATISHAHFVGKERSFFGRDVRNAFKDYERQEESMPESEKSEHTLASIVQRVVRNYADKRVEMRTGVSFEEAIKQPSGPNAKKYNEELDRVTRDAFLAIRSRTGGDFVQYFTGTLCSIRHQVGKAGYELLAAALLDKDRIEEVRTLTMLALSTVSGVYEKKQESN